MKEPPQETGQATDRSGTETGKKIERKQAGNREMRELKFALDKK
jgi:phage terminase large subunit-like protein